MAESRRQSRRRGSARILKFATTADFVNYKGADAAAGDRFWDTTNGTLRAYDGTTWNTVSAPSSAAVVAPALAGTATATTSGTSEAFSVVGLTASDNVQVTPATPSVGAVINTTVATNSLTVNSSTNFRVGDKLNYVVFRAV